MLTYCWQNMLIFSKAPLIVKLCDFGICVPTKYMLHVRHSRLMRCSTVSLKIILDSGCAWDSWVPSSGIDLQRALLEWARCRLLQSRSITVLDVSKPDPCLRLVYSSVTGNTLILLSLSRKLPLRSTGLEAVRTEDRAQWQVLPENVSQHGKHLLV